MRLSVKHPPAGQHTGIAGLPADIPLIPMLFGLACIDVWSSWQNEHGAFFSTSTWPLGLGGVVVLVSLAATVFYSRSEDACRRDMLATPRVVLTLGVLWCLASVGISLGGGAWSSISTIVGGAVMTLAYIFWGSVYARMELRNAVTCILVSVAFGSLLKIGLSFLDPVLQSGIVHLCPIGAALSLARSVQATSSIPVLRKPPYAEDSSHPVVAFALCLFVCQVAMSGIRLLNLDPDNAVAHGTALHIGEVLLAAAILCWVLVAGRSLRFVSLWAILFAMLMTSLLLICVWQSVYALVLCNLSQTFSRVLVFAAAVDFCQHSKEHPYFSPSVMRLAVSVPPWVSYLLSQATLSLDPGTFAAVMMWGLSIASVAFMAEKGLTALRLFDGLEGSTLAPAEVTRLERLCKDIGTSHGLTAREAQVMTLVCAGKSKLLIAEELSLSETTIKSHVRNIYTKMGVHSKNELQRLVNQPGDKNADE